MINQPGKRTDLRAVPSEGHTPTPDETRAAFRERKLAEMTWNDGTGAEETRGQAYVAAGPDRDPFGEYRYPQIVGGEKPEPCAYCGSDEPHEPHAMQKLEHVYRARLASTTRPRSDAELFPTLEEIDAAIAEDFPELDDWNVLSPGDALLFRHRERILSAEDADTVTARLRARLGPEFPVLVFGGEWSAHIIHLDDAELEQIGETGEPMTAVEEIVED